MACIIKSAKFYADSNKIVTFELRDSSGNVMDDTTHFVIIGDQVLPLNFQVPASTNMQLGISSSNSGLYRNNDGASYPYDIGGLLNITGSSVTQTGYYYFYYDIEVETPCISSAGIYNQGLNKVLIKITDIMGRIVNPINNTLLIYIYKDGSVEKKFIFE